MFYPAYLCYGNVCRSFTVPQQVAGHVVLSQEGQQKDSAGYSGAGRAVIGANKTAQAQPPPAKETVTKNAATTLSEQSVVSQ